MLSSISWQEFIITLIVLAVIYYLVTALVLYRKEIANLIKNGSQSLRNDEKPSVQKEERPRSMMGNVSKASDRTVLANTTRESSDELNYAETDELPDPIEEAGRAERDEEHKVLVGNISDLLEEIKGVCGAVTDSGASKEEATVLFEALLSRFQELKHTPYQSSISDHIYSVTREPFIVNFSREEIDAFWNSEA